MQENGFVDWATIAGGGAGFLSFIFVVYEKFSKRPKIVTSVRSQHFRLSRDKDPDQYIIDAAVSLEIGNLGDEATTITEVGLHLPHGVITSKQFERLGFVVEDFNTRICEKGIAFIEHFKFFGWKQPDVGDVVIGRVVLKLLGGKSVSQQVEFKVER